jgi:hypothetical protein
MEELVVLYFIDLTYGSVGQGRVSIADLARWHLVSKPTVEKFMRGMVAKELVTRHEISAQTGNGFIVKYTMTQIGKNWLDDNYPSAYELYRIQVAKILAAIEAQKPKPEYRILAAKEKRQIEAGQKELL